MKELRVYGYRSYRKGSGSQTREIVAVKSRAAAQRAYTASGLRGATIGDVKSYGSWTGNAEELKIALAEPGVVFSRIGHRGPFMRQPEVKPK